MRTIRFKKAMFFSEEKNQKTFILSHAARSRPWPVNGEAAEKQKSFGSFLQKRTFFLLSKCLITKIWFKPRSDIGCGAASNY
jgi:hypothetical protein